MSKPPSSSHNLGLEIDGDVQTSNQEFRTYPKPPRYSADFVLRSGTYCDVLFTIWLSFGRDTSLAGALAEIRRIL
ncbi:hypothetical protein LINGRAHAP2_LOCUS6518, partial [Linum grandiflorum]